MYVVIYNIPISKEKIVGITQKGTYSKKESNYEYIAIVAEKEILQITYI